MSSNPLLVEISAGELFDRIAILEIKSDRLKGEHQLRNVRRDLAQLVEVRDRAFPDRAAIASAIADLKAVNAQLWQIEDDLRGCEARQDFGAAFIALARSVYRLNDRRAALKRVINDQLKSAVIEEKSYRASPSPG